MESDQGIVIGNIDEFGSDGAAMRMVKAAGHRLCLVRTSDGVFALDQACPHEGYGLTTGQLATGTADGDVITCAWHNWKFRVADGACVMGEEDVQTHRVDVAPDGTMRVQLTRPDPETQRPRLLDSLRRGMERNFIGQVSRDVVRLLRADTNPGELIWEAVAFGAPRNEFGWGHSIASLTDCLGMLDRYPADDSRALPIVQAIAGVAETTRGHAPRALPDPVLVDAEPDRGRARFRRLVEAERLDEATAVLRGAIAAGSDADETRGWFTDVVSDHLLGYGHGAIYAQKAFQLVERIGWERADTVLPHLVPTIVGSTREDLLPYMRLFHRGVDRLDVAVLVESANEPDGAWEDDGRLLAALLGDDRTEAALATGVAIAAGAGLDGVLDTIVVAVAERMLRYDPAGEFDLHDDFGWLDITHGLTYANAVRWHVANRVATAGAVDADLVRLVMWCAFLANWTGRHEWHTSVGRPAEIDAPDGDLATYGRRLQDASLLDSAGAFIVQAHAVKTTVAASEEAVRIGSAAPLDAVARFLDAPRLERFVAANVVRSIDFLSDRTPRD